MFHSFQGTVNRQTIMSEKRKKLYSHIKKKGNVVVNPLMHEYQ